MLLPFHSGYLGAVPAALLRELPVFKRDSARNMPQFLACWPQQNADGVAVMRIPVLRHEYQWYSDLEATGGKCGLGFVVGRALDYEVGRSLLASCRCSIHRGPRIETFCVQNNRLVNV
jgi:hypothetical protein